jgi:hypothetical protein
MMELFQIKHKGPRGGERTYLIVNGFADVERYIQRRRLLDAKYKRLAVDFANPRIVDARTDNGAGESGPNPQASRPARVTAGSRQPQAVRENGGDRIERVRNSFQVRAENAWA